MGERKFVEHGTHKRTMNTCLSDKYVCIHRVAIETDNTFVFISTFFHLVCRFLVRVRTNDVDDNDEKR